MISALVKYRRNTIIYTGGYNTVMIITGRPLVYSERASMCCSGSHLRNATQIFSHMLATLSCEDEVRHLGLVCAAVHACVLVCVHVVSRICK